MYFKNKLILKITKNLLNTRFKSKWITPVGYDTSIKVYNCVAREKVAFIVKNKDYVTWYTCGPTVYDSAHLGHASCYVKLDIIQRILQKHFDLNIVSVMNITDIDDKIINRGKALSTRPSEIAKKYENEFWEDLKYLNINKPDIVLKVTDNVPVIKKFISKLLETGRAYANIDGTVYFQLDKYPSYGKLQNIGTTEGSENKKSAGDFALWKGVKPGEPFWEADWGSGRPGWHIECSAMASAVFGSNIDVHAGGIDLRFPHHENEEAQSCAHYDSQQWVNYWLHTGHLHLLHDEKMSKSLKNTILIKELSKNTPPDVFRMACAMSHYRANMEFSSEVIKTAETYVKKIKSFLNECESYINGYLPKADINESELLTQVSKSSENISEALKDDFNTAKAIKIIVDLISVTNKMFTVPASNIDINLNNSGPVLVVSKFVQEQLNIFGFHFDSRVAISADNVDNILNILNSFRQNVRNYALENKDKTMLTFCDVVRTELMDQKINVQDFGKVSSWNRL